MRLLRDDVDPRRSITREALENAAASIAATGGSTNGVLHLLAIARELNIPLELEDFDRIAPRTPIVASLKPGGRFVATDLHAAGGVALVARELLKQGLVHGDAPTVDGRTLGEAATAVVETPGQEVVVPIDAPIKPTGGLADPARQPRARGLGREAGRPRAAPPPRPGARLRLRGGVLRRREGALDPAGRRRRDPLRGPGGRARDAGDAARHGGARRRGARRRGRAGHRRPLLGRDARAHGRPRRAGGRARRTDRGAPEGDTVVVDVEARELRVELSEDELAARLADWAAPEPRYEAACFAKYAALVSSASEGAVTRPRELLRPD